MSPTVREIMRSMAEHLDPVQAKNMNMDLQFKFNGSDPYVGYLHIEDGAGTIHEGQAPQPRLTVSCKSEVWVAIITGKKDAFQAFMLGEMHVSGDMGLAMKLQKLFTVN
ncbi:MAG: SCP2 sterol-binding domain-containing protein [Anaerolineae bacterium]